MSMVVQPGQVFTHPGTLKHGSTLTAEGGPPGESGGIVEVATYGANDGTVILQGGQTGGGFGADLVVDGTGVNNVDGKVIVDGGAGGHASGKAGGTGGTLTINGTGTNDGKVILSAGDHGSAGGAAGTGALLVDNGSLSNAGTIDVQGKGAVAAAIDVTTFGVLTDSGVIGGTGTILNDGKIFGAASGAPSGVIEVAIINDGTLISDGKLLVSGAVSGTGTIEIGGGAVLSLGNAVDADQTVIFENVAPADASGSSLLDLADPSAFLASIEGFTTSDELNLTGLAYVPGETSATYDSGILTVTDGAETDTFTLIGVDDGTEFTTTRDADGGTDVHESALCFVVGTRIATPGGEVAVEDLLIGDSVLTLHGLAKPIKWIGRRAYEGRFIAGNHLMMPVCIKAGALAPELPRRDLHVSAGHGLYIDGVIVPAWRLINGISVTQPEAVESVSYIHLELEDHDVILAEGAPSETFLDEESRGLFANVAEYAELYPVVAVPAQPYALRIDDGFLLDGIIRRVAARAFIAEPKHRPGALRGYVEIAGPNRLVGWAQDEAHPNQPVCLDVVHGGRRVLRLLANRYRADLRVKGLGNGCHGFDLVLPAELTGEIELLRAADLAPLGRAGAARRTA